MQFAKVVSAAVLSGCLLVGVWGTPVMAQSGGDDGGGDVLVFDILGVTDDADRAEVETLKADVGDADAQPSGDGGGGDILVFDILGVTNNADAQSPAFDGRLLTARDLTTER